MVHLGDITKIHGYDAPAVDCIIGGSPCQDLSIAGKRAGLQGERSGLFMEQIRIIKEMRERDKSTGRTGRYVRPRYMVWENVPGAFSSHKGSDFAAVLEETIHIIEPEAPPIPVPKKGWPKSGCLMGTEWSLAWRVFDAQFWGVPQRRKRIALVADFGGESAPEILFERNGLSWNPDKSRSEGKTIEESTQNRSAGNNRMATTRADAYTLKIRSGCAGGGKGALVQTEKAGTLSTRQDQTLFQLVAEPTFCIRGNGDGTTVPTITGDHESRITDYTAIAVDIYNGTITGDKAASLTCRSIGSHSGPKVIEKIIHWIVRRLTPLECERLQGFPDGWTDIGEWVDSKGRKRKSKDGPRYKALGNSIALPPWKWVLKRLSAQYERDATMASLFDGIGGFPLIWEQLNGKGSCLWASEVEEFPIAVTRIHFPEKAGENNG